MPEAEPQTKGRTARDPQALTSEYHKARKQLMLWAGILFIWELVGIDLEKAKEAGGNAGAVITAIKSPQAVPWVLLILVAYFLFKTTVEWYQCSRARRSLRVSRIDFGSAWFVTVLACALYAYQAISRIQFADVVQRSNRTQSIMIAATVGLTYPGYIKRVYRNVLVKKEKGEIWWSVFGLLPIVVVVLGMIRGIFNWRYIVTGIILSAVLGLCVAYIIRRALGVSNA